MRPFFHLDHPHKKIEPGMAENIQEIYGNYLVKLVLQALQPAVGQPATTVTDNAQFQKTVIDPGWNMIPVPLRVRGRDKLRWDDFLRDLRKHVYGVSAGKIGFQSDLETRIANHVGVFFSTSPSRPVPPPLPNPEPMEESPSETRRKNSAAAPPMAAPVSSSNPKKKPTPSSGSTSNVAGNGPEIAVGIDLGTTYSVVAYIDGHGRPTTIPNAAGDLITPSVVLFEEGSTVVGKEAVQAAAMEPHKVAVCVKRDMGKPHFSRPINGEKLPPEVISSVILRSLKADAERKLGFPIRKSVITVPAYFDETRRQATIDAGKLAGLEVLDILNEPTSAAIAYGYQIGFLDRAGHTKDQKMMRALVYDLGGGTFDVTIVEIQENSFRAIATDGDVLLGGKDWDEKIIEYAAESFQSQFGQDPREDPQTLQEMWASAELVKKTLSERPKATMYVSCQGQRCKVEISREQFEDITSDLLGRTQTTTEIVVRQANLRWNQIDKVLLVGGSTRMPQVQKMLEDLTGKTPERSISADEAVAHGAALYAELILRRQGKINADPHFSVTNVNSHSLGIVAIDPLTNRKKNQVIIPKNTQLPKQVSATFRTHKANQSNIAIRIVEGESERPEACNQVGVCVVNGLPATLPKGWPVTISYRYAEDGRLEVTAQVKGQSGSTLAEFQRENRLSSEDIHLWSQYVHAVS